MPDSLSRHARETDPTLLRLRLMGQMEARTLTGESVLPVGGKTRALLAILALSDRKPVLRSRLAELLWSQRPEDMARASLRQEIHRLLDALSPLGVDVIDVQRHSLALKPALTSVDAERLLTASVRTIDGLSIPDEPLLGELIGIDPALDEWLLQQRERLSAHLLHLYESALRELTDPAQVEEMADRLLRLDSLNEEAWRSRIQSALHRGERIRAEALVEQMARLFEEIEGPELSEGTQAFIADMSSLVSEGGSGTALPQAALSSGVGDGSVAAPVPRFDPMLALPLHYASKAGEEISRRISLVFLTPDMSSDIASDQGCGLRDQLELIFVQMGVFDILAVPENSLPDPANAAAVYRSWGTDYIISGNIRSGGEHGDNRLIMRVLDARRGGIISWGTYYEFPVTGLQEARTSLLTPAQAMQWSIFVAEARRIAARPDSELSPLGMALRAFTLLTHHDCALFGRMDTLLEQAVSLGQDDGLIALIDALYCYIRFLNDWAPEADAIFQRGLRSIRTAIAQKPDLKAFTVLLAAYLMHDPSMQAAAASIVRAAMDDMALQDRYYEDSPDYLLAHIISDLLGGKVQAAAAHARIILKNGCRSQLLELLRPVFMMVLLVGGEYQEVIAMGRVMAGLYPSCPGSLVYYLVALVEGGEASEEIAQVRRHLMRLKPDLTVAKIMGRFSFVGESGQTQMAEALEKAGLPRS